MGRVAGWWQRVNDNPQGIMELWGFAIAAVFMGALSLLFLKGPPPPKSALEHTSGRVTEVEISTYTTRGGNKIVDAVRFRLDDGSKRTYLVQYADDIETVAAQIDYARASIFEPELAVGFERGEPGSEVYVFEVTVEGETLVRYSEVAGQWRFEQDFIPWFASITISLGLVAIIFAYRGGSREPVPWHPKPPAVRAPRLYRRLGLHHVFGPADRWFG